MTGSVDVIAEINARFQVQTLGAWLGWKYEEKGELGHLFDMPFKLNAVEWEIPLETTCACMKSAYDDKIIDASEYLSNLF